MSSRFFENPISRSLGLHLLLLLMALFYALHAPAPVFNSEPIEISVLEPKTENDKERTDQKKTIVQKSAGQEVKEAKKDAYLSDKSRVVQEERSAKVPGEAVTSAAASKAAQNTKSPTKAIKLSDLGLKISPKTVPTEYKQQRNWANSQTGESMTGGQYLQGMKEGDTSALNTKEFIFFSYFDRVRKQLDQSWQPILRENIQKIFRSGRKLASNEDYVTRTLVTLNQKGEIEKVQLLEESGTHDLDQAAVDALNRAGPYPNPPKGLINESGTVQIRWDFILKT